MPIYEYQCSRCGETFEAFQRITDDPLTECKFCRGRVEKLFSQSSFQLKGTGWYMTDYARKSKPAGDSESKPADKKDAPKEAAKESKGDK